MTVQWPCLEWCLIIIVIDYYDVIGWSFFLCICRFQFRLRWCIKQSRQCLTSLFPKHLKACQKYSAMRHVFNTLLRVWKCARTRSYVFDSLYSQRCYSCMGRSLEWFITTRTVFFNTSKLQHKSSATRAFNRMSWLKCCHITFEEKIVVRF